MGWSWRILGITWFFRGNGGGGGEQPSLTEYKEELLKNLLLMRGINTCNTGLKTISRYLLWVLCQKGNENSKKLSQLNVTRKRARIFLSWRTLLPIRARLISSAFTKVLSKKIKEKNHSSDIDSVILNCKLTFCLSQSGEVTGASVMSWDQN